VLEALQTGNLALRLAVEAAALVALGMWGWHRGGHGWRRLGRSAAAPVAAATLWAVLASPGSATPGPVQAVVQVAVLGSATGGLAATGRRGPAAVFAAVAVGNAALMAVWGQ
jgi:hypothetical protein